MIPTRLHGMLDYAVGLLMVAAPWLFGFAENHTATALFVALGAGALLYSAFTDYELGVVKRLSMPIHLLLDGASGALLAASPWILGFSEEVWVPHVAFGVFEVVAAVATRRRPSYHASRR